MLRIFIAITLIIASFLHLSAQDVLIDKKGNELPCKLIGADRKYFTYKGFQDPEFTSQKTAINKIRRIRYADGREIKVTPPATGWIMLGIGPAIPLGSYASGDPDDPYAGFAQTNAGIQSEIAIPAFGKNKQWSIVLVGGGFVNKTDGMGKWQWYQSQNGGGVLSGGVSGSNNENQWKMSSLVVGVGYTIPLSWKFAVDQKIAAGPGVAYKYNEHYTFTIPGQPAGTFYNYYSYGQVKSNGDTARAQSVTAVLHYGAAVRFFLSQTLAVRLGADFQYSSPSFNIHQQITPTLPSGQVFDPNHVETVHSRIFVARIQLGVCINLLPKKNRDYGITQ